MRNIECQQCSNTLDIPVTVVQQNFGESSQMDKVSSKIELALCFLRFADNFAQSVVNPAKDSLTSCLYDDFVKKVNLKCLM